MNRVGRVVAIGALAVFFAVAVTAGGADTFSVRLVSQDATTITLGWTPQPGYGYLFSSAGLLRSRTNDPSRSQVRFSKVTPPVYDIDVIVKGANGHYPLAASPACSDQVDNDTDGLVDFPADPGCTSASDSDETDVVVKPQCSDGVDNDADGKVDYPADLGCSSASDTDETDPPTGGTAPWLGSMNASYQAAQPGQTIVMPGGTYGSQIIAFRNLPSCDPNDPSQLVTLDVPNTVTINGNLEVHGRCVFIRGRATGTIQTWKTRTFTLNVTGYTSMEGDSSTQWPRGVRIEGLNTGNLGTYSSEDVVVRDADVGPRLLDVPCQYPENRIAQNGAAAGKTPKNILWERVAIHDQNRTQAAANNDCHYGGLQFWGAINAKITHSVFERNVVYQVEVQGPNPGEISFTSFGCPAENSWLGDRCDGQRAVQFRTTTAWGDGFTLTDNAAANGANGLYGCYESPCDFAAMNIARNTDLVESATAPPVP